MGHVGIVTWVFIAVLTANGLTAEARDKSGVLKVSTVVGMKVQDTEGTNLGDIKDLVIDPTAASGTRCSISGGSRDW